MLVPKLRFKREDGTDYPEWKTNELKTIFPKIRNGFVGTVSDSFADKETGIRYIEGTNIHNGIISDDVEIYVTKAFHENHLNSQLKADDIVMVQSGHIGDCAVVGAKYAGSNCHALIIMSNGGHCDSRFYSFYFHCDSGYNKMKMYMQGNTVKHILASDMQTFIVPIPDLEEQQKIADFLSTVDEVIAQSEAEVQNLEQQKKAAMQKIFSQEVRFKREDGTDYPEWGETDLNSIGSFYGGLSGKTKENFGKGNSKFVTYMNVYKNVFASQEMLEFVDVSDNEKQNKVQYGDLLMTQSSETVEEVGMSSVYLFRDEPYLNSFCFGLHLHNLDYTNPMYVGYLMRSESIRKQIMSEGQGISRINLSPNRIRGIILPIPCLEEQQKIADFLSAYDEAISYAKQELDKWKELKKGLLQQMFV